MYKIRKYIIFVLICILMSGLISGCNNEQENTIPTVEDFADAKIGILTGSSQEGIAKEKFPDAERVYFNSPTDMFLAVKQDKIDCCLYSSPFLTVARWDDLGIKQAAGTIAQGDIAFAFPETEESRPLKEQMNEFIISAKNDGTIEALTAKWLGDSEPSEHPDYSNLTGENGTICVAVSSNNKPLMYKYKEQYTGFEMELLTLFAKENGYDLQLVEAPLDSVILGLTTGKFDMIAYSLQITEEREQSVDFSEPFMKFDVIFVVKDNNSDDKSSSQNHIEEFEPSKLGTFPASPSEIVSIREFPDAEIFYYPSFSDLAMAVKTEKIDGFILDKIFYYGMTWESDDFAYVERPLEAIEYAYVISKNNKGSILKRQIDEFIAKLDSNGELERLHNKWISETEPNEAVDLTGFTGENGTINIAVSSDCKPLIYRKNNEYNGFEIEILAMFAKEYGYSINFIESNFDGILMGVETGKFDMGAFGISPTEEREESVVFSAPTITGEMVLITKRSNLVQNDDTFISTGFTNSVKESFEKTFIRENRWKMILEGMGVTLLITICSAIAGTLLGFGLYMLSRSEIKPIRFMIIKFSKIYTRIISGTPVVVILMILFYVVFGKFRDISGILVAIIGFTLIFGAFVFEHMTVSVNNVDKGQTEAAYSLGYPKKKAFFRIILPQAMSVFLPTYCGQTVELIKATAIVGYVAVNDLTKMGDIIRSNTYEAFFPLITTALIYFILTWLLSVLLKRIKIKFEPKLRSEEEILKGIDKL